MKCPECGERMLCFDTRYNTEESVQIRKYYCYGCKQGYGTREYCSTNHKIYVKRTKYIETKYKQAQKNWRDKIIEKAANYYFSSDYKDEDLDE